MSNAFVRVVLVLLALVLHSSEAHGLISGEEFVSKLKELTIVIVPVVLFFSYFFYSHWRDQKNRDR